VDAALQDPVGLGEARIFQLFSSKIRLHRSLVLP
jgi:hypothetical protein